VADEHTGDRHRQRERTERAQHHHASVLIGNLGEGCLRPSAYVWLWQQVSQDSDQLAERPRMVTGDLCERAAISPDPVSK